MLQPAKVTSRYGEALSFFHGQLGDYEPFPLSFGHLLPQGGTIQRFKKLEGAQQILRNTKRGMMAISRMQSTESVNTNLIQAP